MRRSELYERICEGVRTGVLIEPFNVGDVNESLDNLLQNSPSFLSKHRVGNPGRYSERFERNGRGLYSVLIVD